MISPTNSLELVRHTPIQSSELILQVLTKEMVFSSLTGYSKHQQQKITLVTITSLKMMPMLVFLVLYSQELLQLMVHSFNLNLISTKIRFLEVVWLFLSVLHQVLVMHLLLVQKQSLRRIPLVLLLKSLVSTPM